MDQEHVLTSENAQGNPRCFSTTKGHRMIWYVKRANTKRIPPSTTSYLHIERVFRLLDTSTECDWQPLL